MTSVHVCCDDEVDTTQNFRINLRPNTLEKIIYISKIRKHENVIY